jgi:hypothetical protein
MTITGEMLIGQSAARGGETRAAQGEFLSAVGMSTTAN